MKGGREGEKIMKGGRVRKRGYGRERDSKDLNYEGRHVQMIIYSLHVLSRTYKHTLCTSTEVHAPHLCLISNKHFKQD